MANDLVTPGMMPLASGLAPVVRGCTSDAVYLWSVRVTAWRLKMLKMSMVAATDLSLSIWKR